MHGQLQLPLINNVDFYQIITIFIKKKIGMGRYNLTLKTGEIIHTIIAESFEDAIKKFCFKKKFDRYVLLHLFDVIKEI